MEIIIIALLVVIAASMNRRFSGFVSEAIVWVAMGYFFLVALADLAAVGGAIYYVVQNGFEWKEAAIFTGIMVVANIIFAVIYAGLVFVCAFFNLDKKGNVILDRNGNVNVPQTNNPKEEPR